MGSASHHFGETSQQETKVPPCPSVTESILPTCALGVSLWKISPWKGAAQQHRDHAGQGQHTASTPGPPAVGKRWSDVQITAQARWFSGKSCRIWLRGPAEKLVLLLNPPTQQQRALCTAEHNRQGPTTLLPLQGETPSKAFKIRDLI